MKNETRLDIFNSTIEANYIYCKSTPLWICTTIASPIWDLGFIYKICLDTLYE